MAEMNSILAASLDKLLQKESAFRKEGSASRLYLRDAAMTRMTYILKNSTEKIGVIGLNYSVPKQLDSEMPPDERNIIKQWATGASSGRFAMVAFLDCRRQNRRNSSPQHFNRSLDSRPLGLLTNSINFPLEYLSSESQLYAECFGRPPAGVLREALEMLTKKAMEDSPMSLRPEQIDLAWRQMKIERLSSRYVEVESSSSNLLPPLAVDPECEEEEGEEERAGGGENVNPQVKPAPERKRSSIDLAAATAESYSMIVLEIMMEMVRMFHSGELSSAVKAETMWLDESSSSALMDMRDLEEHLDTPIQQVVEQASKLSTDELDQSNLRIKNYVQSLSNLKADLTKQLQEVQDTAMYATLGITSSTSEEQIKKAYRSMAIRLHPDRKGGDTKKFQQLQSAYQDILKKRRIDGTVVIEPEVAAAELTEVMNAEQLMLELAELLDTVKVAAEQCAMLAQLCIQGQKMMESAAKDAERPLAGMNALLTDDTSLGRISQQVIEPLETGCEYMQSIAAKAMTLPTLGNKFANATAIVGGFTRCVEKTMSAGLESLRSVTEVMSADLQLSVCRQKVSRMLHENSSAADEAVEVAMVDTTMRCFQLVCASMCTAADKVVHAAEKCGELIDLVAVVISRAEVEAVADRRRQAEKAERESEQPEGGYEGEQNNTSKPEPKEAPNDEVEEEEPGADVVDTLMKKVKALQMQLRLQNIQSMQTLNSSAVEMQSQLHAQLASIDIKAGLSPGAFETYADSILTLIAEIIDGSCNGLHLECEGGAVADLESWNVCTEKHLGWMRLKPKLKIALLPDLRSRTLWFVAMAQIDSLRNIIMSELPGRLTDCLRRAHSRCSWAVLGGDGDSVVVTAHAGLNPSKYIRGTKVMLIPEVGSAASIFCAGIMSALESLRENTTV